MKAQPTILAETALRQIAIRHKNVQQDYQEIGYGTERSPYKNYEELWSEDELVEIYNRSIIDRTYTL